MILAKARKDRGSSKVVFLKMVVGPFGVGSEDLFGDWYFLSGQGCERQGTSHFKLQITDLLGQRTVQRILITLCVF